MNNTKDIRGFTLMEMVVVLAVIAILAAILTPIINSYVDRARLNAAKTDTKNIAAAMVQFNTDAKFWPIYTGTSAPTNQDTATNYDWLSSEGDDVTLPSSWTTSVTNTNGNLDTVLNTNVYGLGTSGSRSWRGPYLTLARDPWGGKYYVNSKNLKPSRSDYAAYVVSAGPNSTMETAFDQNRSGSTAFAIGGDDVVARIR